MDEEICSRCHHEFNPEYCNSIFITDDLCPACWEHNQKTRASLERIVGYLDNEDRIVSIINIPLTVDFHALGTCSNGGVVDNGRAVPDSWTPFFENDITDKNLVFEKSLILG
jgi:hypothetical protein